MTLPADVLRVSVFGENMYLYQCVNLAAVSGVLWPGSVYTRVPSVNIANGEQIYWQLGNDTAAKLHSVHLYCLLWSWRQQFRCSGHMDYYFVQHLRCWWRGRGAAGGRGGGSVQCPHLVISEPLWPCLAIITRLLAPHNNATGNTVKNISYQQK